MNTWLTWALVGIAVVALVFFFQWRSAKALVEHTRARLSAETQARERAERGTARVVDYSKAKLANEVETESRVSKIIASAKAEAAGASRALVNAGSADASEAASAYKAWASSQRAP